MKNNYRNNFLKLMIFLVVGAFILTASTPLASNVSIKHISEQSNVVLLPSSENEYVFTFNAPEITQTVVTTDYGVFSLFTQSSGFIGELGKPQLPRWNRLYSVPSDQVTLEVVDAHVVDSFDVGLVYPAQLPQTDSVSVDTDEFFFDESFYEMDVVYPGRLVDLKNSGNVRDIPFVEVEFYPVQYNLKRHFLW